ncbi:unnamed protein product [Amoebophrya sp. A25]|nr:unnamed protein product [Amoebophrya sp. A25]|eukprot:GSA25T00005209001.1
MRHAGFRNGDANKRLEDVFARLQKRRDDNEKEQDQQREQMAAIKEQKEMLDKGRPALEMEKIERRVMAEAFEKSTEPERMAPETSKKQKKRYGNGTLVGRHASALVGSVTGLGGDRKRQRQHVQSEEHGQFGGATKKARKSRDVSVVKIFLTSGACSSSA